MKEVKFLFAVLIVVLTLLYLDSKEESLTQSASEITIFETSPSEITGLRLVTRTQTIAMSTKKDADGEPYRWFRIESKTSTRAFVGNDKAEKLVERYARLG